ncbi:MULTISPECIES: hypothetical protein [unclassified Plantibacter]|uniref:hypothetical protein n=1 Tax=unclassified Plantibacter TaxID=2624265 RepID=UPI001E3AB885|nr:MULTISPECIES: hypothetical protein [unclassified Plantibacter]
MSTVLERGTGTTVAWAEPDATLWVASVDGEYAGMVEFRDGRFVAASSTGKDLGVFVSLLRAKEAVENGPTKTLQFPYVAAVAASAIVSATAVAFTAFAVL